MKNPRFVPHIFTLLLPKKTPPFNELCRREQEYLYRAIVEDIDLTDHLSDAVNSLRICFAAVESYTTGRTVRLG